MLGPSMLVHEQRFQGYAQLGPLCIASLQLPRQQEQLVMPSFPNTIKHGGTSCM